MSKDGVQVNPSKIETKVQWPKPKNVKSLRAFLGLMGYYKRFVKNYNKIASPLTNLLKVAMTSLPLLAMLDFFHPFELEIDASGFGMGAVLMQNG